MMWGFIAAMALSLPGDRAKSAPSIDASHGAPVILHSSVTPDKLRRRGIVPLAGRGRMITIGFYCVPLKTLGYKPKQVRRRINF